MPKILRGRRGDAEFERSSVRSHAVRSLLHIPASWAAGRLGARLSGRGAVAVRAHPMGFHARVG